MAVPGAAFEAIVPPGATAADVAPSPTSLPVVAASCGPGGREFLGACPYRIFSRFTVGFFVALAEDLGVVVEVVVAVAVGVVTFETGVATGAFEVLLTVEYFVPRSNRFFSWTGFFFTAGGV
jgi:hypothetical protein